MGEENPFLRLDDAMCAVILQHVLLSDNGRSAVILSGTCRQWRSLAAEEQWWGLRCAERYRQIVPAAEGFAGNHEKVLSLVGFSIKCNNA